MTKSNLSREDFKINIDISDVLPRSEKPYEDESLNLDESHKQQQVRNNLLLEFYKYLANNKKS